MEDNRTMQTQFAQIPDDGIRDRLGSRVRFFNAVDTGDAYNFMIDGKMVLSGLTYGIASNYMPVFDGDNRITVYLAAAPLGAPLISQSISFPAGGACTVILIRTAEGIELLQAVDRPCAAMAANTGCIKAGNVSYAGAAFDIILRNREIIFSDLQFEDITALKQAQAGTYQLYVVPASARPANRVLPSLSSGADRQEQVEEPEKYIIRFFITVETGVPYSIYLIGNQDILQVVII